MPKFFVCMVGLILVLFFSAQAHAVLVEYRFSGVLTGDTGMLGLVSLVDAPFRFSDRLLVICGPTKRWTEE